MHIYVCVDVYVYETSIYTSISLILFFVACHNVIIQGCLRFPSVFPIMNVLLYVIIGRQYNVIMGRHAGRQLEPCSFLTNSHIAKLLYELRSWVVC